MLIVMTEPVHMTTCLIDTGFYDWIMVFLVGYGHFISDGMVIRIFPFAVAGSLLLLVWEDSTGLVHLLSHVLGSRACSFRVAMPFSG
jgi:hypothetical protein